MNRKRNLVAWLPVVLWAGLISYLGTDSYSGSWSLDLLRALVALLHLPLSDSALQLANLILRKSAHFAEFFVLGLLVYHAVSQYPHKTSWHTLGWVLLAGASIAGINELQQAFTGSREPSLFDATLDFAGALSSQVWTLRPRFKVTLSVPES